MKEDQLVTMTLQTSQFVQEHFTQVISGVIILIAAVAIIIFTANARRGTARAAERDFALAMSAYQLGDRETAATSFRNIADRYGSQRVGATALYFLGESHLSQFKYNEALVAYDRFVEKAGEKSLFYVGAMVGRALCLEGLRNYAQAAEVMEAALEKMSEEDPRYVEGLFRAARAHQQAGGRDQAIRYYEMVVERSAGPLRDQSNVWLAMLR